MAIDVAPSRARARSGSVLLVWAILLAAANLRASLTGVGPLLDTVQTDLRISSALAGLLNTLPLLAFAVVSPIVPRIAGRFGAERALAFGLGTIGIGIAVRSLPSVASPFIGTVLIGSGIAVGNVLLPSLIKRDFPTKIGLLTSAYAATMSTVAALASGVVVPISHAAVGGWRTAWGCWVVLVIPALIIWAVRIRRHPEHRVISLVKRPRLPWHSGLAWAVTGFMGLQSLGFYILVTWLPSIFHDHGVSEANAGWLLFLMQAVSVLVSLAIPAILHRGHSQRLLAAASSAVSLVGYLGLMLAPGQALLWSVVLGIGGGACIVLALSFLSLRSADAASAGALSAMAQSIGYLLAAAGPVLFGALHAASSGWRIPLMLVSVAAIGQIGVAVLAGGGTVRIANREL